MKKTKLTRSLLAAVSIVALSAVMYGCTHSGDDPVVMEDPPEPTPYEAGLAAINGATSQDAAQAAYDAVDLTAVTGEEAGELQAALDARLEALDMMDRAEEQRTALMDAAGMIDTSEDALSTQDGVDAARTAIAGLRQAIADAVDVDDTSMYQSQLDAAVAAVDTAQGGIDTEGRRTIQMADLETASAALQTALDALASDALAGKVPTQAEIDAANTALTGLNTAIDDAADLTDAEKEQYQREASNAATPISTVQDARDKADEDDQKVDSKSLLRAFNRASDATPAATAPTIASVSASSGGEFEVTLDSTATPTPGEFTLGAAPDMVTGHHGAMLTHDDETMVVYSNISNADAKPLDEAYEETGGPGSNVYGVTNDGASSSIARSDIEVADVLVVTHDTDEDTATFPGSVNGAMGTFSCIISANTCTDPEAADGEITSDLGTIWTFTPNAGARTDVQDTDYLFFGWWLKKATGDWRVDMFTGQFGYADAARTESGLAGGTVTGSATYEGAAAGKFTTVTADAGEAGHFVADAMLRVDFDADLSAANAGNDKAGVSIRGKIERFVANGTSRDWEVALTWDHNGTAADDQTVGSTLESIGAALGDATNRSTATWTSGDDVEMGTGDWNAVFYGSEVGTTHPMAATGEFNAMAGGSDIGNHIAGAFGVEKN